MFDIDAIVLQTVWELIKGIVWPFLLLYLILAGIIWASTPSDPEEDDNVELDMEDVYKHLNLQ